MKVTDSLSLFMKSPEKRRSRFRTSNYPNAYLGDEFKMKIGSIREYFKVLRDPPGISFKQRRKVSPVKIKKDNHLSFAFRSMSASKIVREDIGNRVEKTVKVRKSFSRMNIKSCDRMFKEAKRSELSELIRIFSTK